MSGQEKETPFFRYLLQEAPDELDDIKTCWLGGAYYRIARRPEEYFSYPAERAKAVADKDDLKIFLIDKKIEMLKRSVIPEIKKYCPMMQNPEGEDVEAAVRDLKWSFEPAPMEEIAEAVRLLEIDLIYKGIRRNRKKQEEELQTIRQLESIARPEQVRTLLSAIHGAWEREEWGEVRKFIKTLNILIKPRDEIVAGHSVTDLLLKLDPARSFRRMRGHEAAELRRIVAWRQTLYDTLYLRSFYNLALAHFQSFQVAGLFRAALLAQQLREQLKKRCSRGRKNEPLTRFSALAMCLEFASMTQASMTNNHEYVDWEPINQDPEFCLWGSSVGIENRIGELEKEDLDAIFALRDDPSDDIRAGGVPSTRPMGI